MSNKPLIRENCVKKKKDENVGKSYNITGPDLSFVILS